MPLPPPKSSKPSWSKNTHNKSPLPVRENNLHPDLFRRFLDSDEIHQTIEIYLLSFFLFGSIFLTGQL